MRPDPRCPSCGEKVSATATWCMHCSADFDAPLDAERGGARMERATSPTGDAGSFDEGDVEQTRATLVAAGLGFLAWIVISAVLPLVDWAGVLALAALAALVLHLRTLPSPVDMLVRAGYGTAAILVGLRVYLGWASPGLADSMDGGTLIFAALLVFGAHWADDNRDRFDVSGFETSSGR